MKKLLLILCLIMMVFCIKAQDLTSKMGESYLPESDEWSIGFGATSALNYFGNLFNSNAQAPSADYYLVNQTVYGKLMVDDNTAWRARIGINMSRHVDNTIVADISPNADPGDTETDKYTYGSTNITLALGKEYRRGSTRLQGMYGAEAIILTSSTSEEWDYGNSAIDRMPQGTVIEAKSGLSLGLGARLFIGVEYFIIPKISISGEYGWGVNFTSQGGGSYTTETYYDPDPFDTGDEYVDDDTTDGAADSYFGLSNDNMSGVLGLHFYF